MGSSLLHRTLSIAFWLAMLACPLLAQNLPQRPQPQPLPHPNLAPPAIPSPGLSLWLLIAGGILALLLTAFILWLLFRSHTPLAELAPPPLSRAQKRLQSLLLECDVLPPGETAHRVSVILRDYQQGRYLVPAPFRTREELYDRGEFNVRGVARERFSPIAELCDHLAFAPAPATREEARALVQQSLEALQQESYHVREGAQRPPPLPPRLPAVPPPLPPDISPPVSP